MVAVTDTRPARAHTRPGRGRRRAPRTIGLGVRLASGLVAAVVAGAVVVGTGAVSAPAAASLPAAAALPAAARPLADGQAAGSAQVWSTTPDRANLMRFTGSYWAGRSLGVTSGATVTVNARFTGQSVVGFGAGLTHSSAGLLASLPAAERRRILLNLFDPSGPVRLSVVRIPFGSSDFAVGTPYTYDDRPAGQSDWSLRSFTTAKDNATLRPILREIRAINPKVVVVASPWSAPAWLKSSGSLMGGRLSSDSRAPATYAAYLVRALTEYKAAGLPIDVLTVQNEPQTRWWGDYPRMEMPAAQQIAVINALGPALRNAGLSTQILGFDHNWAQHPADLSAVPQGGDAEADYALRVLRSTAGRWVAGTAYHCYSGDASAQEAVHTAFPRASIWVTECSGTRSSTEAATFADNLYWHSRSLLIPSLEHWASAVLTWNLALDPSGGPHTGGCTTCTPVVTVANGAATPAPDYYVLTHAARFIPRGSVRVGSSVDNGEFEQVAFRTPDGSVVILLHHGGWATKAVTVKIGSATYQVPVAPWSLTTVRVAPGA